MIAAWCYWVAMACSHTRWKSLHPQTNFFCVIDNILFDFLYTWKSSMHKSLAADRTNYLKTSTTCSIIFIDYVWGLEYLEFCFDGKNIGTHKRTEKHRNAITINDFWKRDFLAMIFVRYFTDSKYGEEKMCQFPSEFAVLVSIKRENWDFLKRKKLFFSPLVFTHKEKAQTAKETYIAINSAKKSIWRDFKLILRTKKRG